jgi:hypothetical protein
MVKEGEQLWQGGIVEKLNKDEERERERERERDSGERACFNPERRGRMGDSSIPSPFHPSLMRSGLRRLRRRRVLLLLLPPPSFRLEQDIIQPAKRPIYLPTVPKRDVQYDTI